MFRTRILYFLLAAFFSSGSGALAGDLVYQPLLPAFGGNPLYSSYYSQNADAQNKTRIVEQELSDADRFKRDLERRLLSAVANQIVDAIYGEDATTDGTFVVEGITINFATVGGEVVLTISDDDGVTTIKLPKNS